MGCFWLQQWGCGLPRQLILEVHFGKNGRSVAWNVDCAVPGGTVGVMAASARQRQQAAELLRAGSTQEQAAQAAGVSVSSVKCWLAQPGFRAMIFSSPDIRVGAPAHVGKRHRRPEPQRDLRLRMWVAAEDHEVLGSYIPPASFEKPGAVLHVHVVPPGELAAVRARSLRGSIRRTRRMSRFLCLPMTICSRTCRSFVGWALGMRRRVFRRGSRCGCSSMRMGGCGSSEMGCGMVSGGSSRRC